MWDEEYADDDEDLIEYAVRPNKSQIKRDIAVVFALAEDICALGEGQIEKLGLPENIRIQVAKKSVRRDILHEDENLHSSRSPGIIGTLKEARRTAADQAEREYLRELVSTSGSDVGTACKISGLSRSRYYELLNKHGLSVPRSTAS